MTRNSRAQDAFQQIMEFGSSHVLLVRSGGPTASLNNVASGPPHEVSAAQVRTESAIAVKAEAPRVQNEISKVGTTLTYKEAVLNIKNVYNFTEDVVDWHGLGTQLEISDSRLKKIRREFDTEDGRRRDMIVTWLFGDPEASWEKLSKALVRVNHRVLADQINTEILPLQDNEPLTPREPRAVDTSWTKKGHGAPPPISTTRSGFQMEAAPMVYSDEHGLDHVDSRPPPLPKIKSKCEDRDTNILMIKFGALSKPCKVHTGDPVICSNDQCAAILNCHSKIIKEGGKGSSNVWVCEFCSTQNTIEIVTGEIPKEGDILYLQQVQHSPKDDTLVSGITKDSIVVFCVDTSGSMGVTTEIPGFRELKGHEKLQKLKEIYAGSGIQHIPGQFRNVTYISRLQCAQAAIDHQLTTLARNNPSQRVAIVMFGDEVTVTGEGIPENEFVFVGEKLWKENAILKLSADIPTPLPIKQTKEHLSEKLFSIEEEGQTALGSALLVSIDIAKRAPGSKVILCTDGLANRGIGNLDDHKCTESSAAFYKKLGMTAKESSVSVSVLTIKGTECDLLHIGQVANLSGGNVDVVDPMSLTDEFVNILSTSAVAVRVNAKIILHSSLCLKDGDAKSTLSVPVGNVVDTTNLMYEFSSSEKNKEQQLQEVPFQVQIKYMSLDGQQCLRVFTEVRPVTSDKSVANEGATKSVLIAHRQETSGKYFINSYESLRVCKAMRSCSSTASTSSSIYCEEGSVASVANYCPIPRPCRKMSQGFGRAMNADELAATAFHKMQGRRGRNASQQKLKVQKCITLSNEGYGFGFLVSPGRGGTVVQSLIPNGVAWKDGKLQKDDKLLTINGECVENMAHQDVVRKLKLLNEEATNSITLCVEREEVSEESPSTMQEPKQYQKLPRSKLKTGCDEQANGLAMDTQHGELISVTLQSDGPDSLGLVFKFDDSEQLIIEEILPDRTADKDCRLKVNDTVLEINGEAVTGKTNNAISVMMKDIEESNGSIELLVRRENQTTSKARHEKTKSSHRKPHTLRERFSSWYQSLRSSKVHVPVLEPSRDESCNYLKISLHNEGYGFGFTIKETEDKSIVVSSVLPEGVACKDDRLMANDKLIEINERKVSDMTYKEVIVMLRELNDNDHSIIDLKVQKEV